jgi:UDP-N-acetylglucosamine transferase subunit ALG13
MVQRKEGFVMGTALLVASAGGHFDELSILARAWGLGRSERMWVTSRTPQTESLLADEAVIWLPRVGSGETVKAMAALPAALRIQAKVRPDVLVTTGALFATPHLLAARIRKTETWFVDSATRIDGPSNTAKFAQRFTHAHLFAQGGWEDPRWQRIPSIFDTFESVSVGEAPRTIRSAVVTLGSELWPFHRAVSRLLRLLPDVNVTWQTGTTEARHQGRALTQWIPAADLRASIRAADVVIAHAGVGSALVALDEGKIPILLPRLSRYREMIDDHQVEFGRQMSDKGLAITIDPTELEPSHLLAASRLRAKRADIADDPRWAQIPRPRL